MAMSKRDFVDLADTLRGTDVPPRVLDALCLFMTRQNPRFMESRWLAYYKGLCGPSGDKRATAR